MKTYLDRILAAHRDAANEDTRGLDELIERAASLGPARSFRRALDECDGLAVISEIKRRSPSKGDLNPGLSPDVWASAYEAAAQRV
ncbi:MAG: hypothetical protein R2706_18980 [Acidimicrobiales bacterium]